MLHLRGIEKESKYWYKSIDIKVEDLGRKRESKAKDEISFEIYINFNGLFIGKKNERETSEGVG